MSFMGALNRLVGLVKVKEENNIIQIIGIKNEDLKQDVENVWKSSKFTANMFEMSGTGDGKFHAWFGVELLYVIKKLIETPHTKTSKSHLKSLANGLMEDTWLRNLNQPQPKHLDLNGLNKLTVTMKDHQNMFYQRYDQRRGQYGLKGYLLSAAPGGGKTITSIGIAECNGSDTVVVICPKKAVYEAWEKELKSKFHQPPAYWIADRGGPVPENCRYFIIHNDRLDQALGMVNEFRGKCTLIIDESHNFAELRSDRTQRLLQLASRMRLVDTILLSGTPIKAIPIEAIPLFRLIDPRFTSVVEEAFRRIYKGNNLLAGDILAHRMGLMTFVVPKKYFMSDEPVYHDVKVKMPGSHKFTLENIAKEMRQFIAERTEYYKTHKKTFENVYEQNMAFYDQHVKRSPQVEQDYDRYRAIVKRFARFGFDPEADAPDSQFANRFERVEIIPHLPPAQKQPFRDAKSVVKYVHLKIRGEALGRVIGAYRNECNLAMVPYVPFKEWIDKAEKKTLIFTSTVAVVDAVEEQCRKLGYHPKKVYAATNHMLPEIIKQYDKDPNCNPLIATFDSLSEAVPVTSASTIIMLNTPFRVHEYTQAVARAHRLGQDTTVSIVNIHLDTDGQDNIHGRSNEIMEWSKKQVNAMMGFDSTAEITMESLEDVFHLEQPEVVFAHSRTKKRYDW